LWPSWIPRERISSTPPYIGAAIATQSQSIQAGRAYVVGSLTGNTMPVVNGAQDRTGGGSGRLLMEINPAGADLVYSTYLGGSQRDTGTGVALGTGRNGVRLPDIPIQRISRRKSITGRQCGGYDAFVARIDTH